MKKILIVDDDVELCEELVEMLREEGYSVNTTADLRQVEEHIKSGDFDTMILDYKMPGMTGVDVLRKVKAAKLTKEIFLVSGRPFVEKTLQIENVSDVVSGILHKPINFVELLDRIKNGPQVIPSLEATQD